MRNMNTKNENAVDIYHDDIDYNEGIDQEEMDGLLEYTERNPNFHQDKDKENDKHAEEGNNTQNMKIYHPKKEMILDDSKNKYDDGINE